MTDLTLFLGGIADGQRFDAHGETILVTRVSPERWSLEAQGVGEWKAVDENQDRYSVRVLTNRDEALTVYVAHGLTDPLHVLAAGYGKL